jgi:hypothetical protein
VTIVCRNEQLQLDPQCPEIAAALGTVSRTAVPDAEHGYRLTARRESLLEPRVPRPNAGLLPAVCRLLGQAGCQKITLRRSSEPPATLPVPAEGAVRWQGLCDTQMLAMVQTQDHGLIRYGAHSGIDLAWLIAQIALAFPQATIAVVVASVDFGHRLRQRIGQWVRGVVVLDARPNTRPVGRVVIGTPYGLADDAVEFNKRDVVLVPRAQDALQEHAQVALMAADPRFRLFGFLPADCKLSPSEQDWIRAMFAFSEVFIPRHGFVERPVRAVWSPVDGGPRLPLGVSVLELKRLGIWQHPVRNRRIARIAAEFSRRDTAWLRHRVPEVAVVASMTTACRVVVLVEGVDHALALANLLPDWPVIVGDGVCEAGFDHYQRQLFAQRRAMPNTSCPVIATLAGLALHGALDFNSVDVLIWAGAGKHLSPLPADRMICRPEQARALLLVDFADRHHPQLRRWTRYRREEYQDAGWIAPGTDPVKARIDRFLARRPGRRAR